MDQEINITKIIKESKRTTKNIKWGGEMERGKLLVIHNRQSTHTD